MTQAPEQDAAPSRRPRVMRKLLIGSGVVLALVLLVIVFAGPSIAAAVVVRVVRGLDVPGRIEVESVALSWLGDVVVRDAALYEADGTPVGLVSARTSGGLLDLLDGRLDAEIVVDGWAVVEIDQDGMTNIDRALGLQRGAEADAAVDAERAGLQGQLPVSSVVLDGLDVAVSRAGAATLALAGLSGTLNAEGQRVAVEAQASLTMPADRPTSRDGITQADEHGSITITGNATLDDLDATLQATIDELTSEAARALGALSGDEAVTQASAVAAEGGLSLQLDARLESGVPVAVKLDASSATISAALSFGPGDAGYVLEEPGAIEADLAAFLAQQAVRRVLLPGEGVSVVEAGRLTLSVNTLTIPKSAEGPRFDQASADVLARIGPTTLSVPGADGAPTRVRISQTSASLTATGGSQATLDAELRASLEGQDEGVVRLEAIANLDRIQRDEAAENQVDARWLASLAPRAQLTLQGMPTLAAKPWLGALEAAGLDLPEVVGPTVDATIAWSPGEGPQPRALLVLTAEHLEADVLAEWREDAIVLARPASVRVGRPAAIASPWLPEGWSMDSGRSVAIELASLALPMQGLTPRPTALTGSGVVRASEVRVDRADLPRLGVDDLVLSIEVASEETVVEVASKPTIGGRRGRLDGTLRTAGMNALLAAEGMPTVTGEIEAIAPTQALAGFGPVIGDRPLHEWLADAAGDRVTVQVSLVPPDDANVLLAGGVVAQAEHASVQLSGVDVTRDRAAVASTVLTATPSTELWDALASMLGLDGSRLDATAPLTAEVGPASIAFDASTAFASGFDETSVSLAAGGPLRIADVPVARANGDGQVRRETYEIAALTARLDSLGPVLAGGGDVRGSMEMRFDRPDAGPVAFVEGTLATGDAGAMQASLIINELDTAAVSSLAGLSDATSMTLVGVLGNDARIEVQASATPAPRTQRGWSLARASLAVQSPRLQTAAPVVAEFTDDNIALVEPARLSWDPDEAWLGRTIGARVKAAQPFDITLQRIELGNPLGGRLELLDPQAVFIDASVNGNGAVIAIENRPDIDLETVTARVRRTGLSTYTVTANAAAAGGGVLELNGLIEKPTDELGRLNLNTAVVRGTLKGDDIPVALADAMSNTDGLLADSLGPQVDLDAEISDGRLVPGEPPSANLRFSVRGPRADASGYGRLADHVISMPEPQTILTVREVGPEIAARFSQLVPELLLVEKRPEDGPAVVRTEGLAIPTNGDWSKGNGSATIALGTARFRTSSLLRGVLKATGQRDQGQIGRRIAPIDVRMTSGVIEYEPFTLPLGDLTIESEGTVDLVGRQMDVIVWLPTAALSDEAAGRFNTGLGSAIGRSIPGFESITTVPWRVSGPLDDPGIRPAPRVLLERRGDELLGPLLNPGQTLQDLLGLPGPRKPPGD